MKTLSLLGSTGSIGTQAVEIIRSNPERFRVLGLTTNSNIDLLKKQIDVLNPIAVAVMEKAKADELREKTDVQVYDGISGLKKIATLEKTDTILNALVGSIGTLPTHEAILAGKNIALANKETLITAGEIIMEEARRKEIKIMPIDSEHSAIFQCLNGEKRSELKKITLTCSGGPFKNRTLDEMKKITIKEALNHPTWTMGPKITIDSSTWMNKGFEVIEAHHLFGVPYENIEVIIHPQSIIHSLVEFEDNSTIAQMGFPTMEIPIQYALTYPQRLQTKVRSLDLAEAKKLDFFSPDFERFPCLALAYDAGKMGGVMPAILNAANEVAVGAFLNGEINYIDIPKIIRQALDNEQNIKHPTLSKLMEIDSEVKQKTQKRIKEL